MHYAAITLNYLVLPTRVERADPEQVILECYGELRCALAPERNIDLRDITMLTLVNLRDDSDWEAPLCISRRKQPLEHIILREVAMGVAVAVLCSCIETMRSPIRTSCSAVANGL